MKTFITILTALFSTYSVSLFAQGKTGNVTGIIYDEYKKPIEAATSSLFKSQDSTLVKTILSDKSGRFGFEKISYGKYYVSISSVGRKPSNLQTVEVNESSNNIALSPINLIPLSKLLTAVNVNTKKPLIEQKAGKTIINVEASSTNTGLNALELLEKSPGVTIDNDDNISLKGKQGVLILIDGKPSYLSGKDLAALLKSMQSTSLSQIEIMTNPPAKYDAAGNSGIINIKTKKGTIKGMNGNTTLGYSQGVYGRINGGLNINYRNNKLNLFGGYNGGNYENYNSLNIKRSFYKADKQTISGTAEQLTTMHFKGDYHNVKAGLDYYFSDKDVAGFVINGNFNTHHENSNGDSYIKDGSGGVNYKLISEATNKRLSTNISSNFNYKHTFDSAGRELSADLDYVYYNNTGNSRLSTQSYNASNVKDGNDIILHGNIPSIINIYSAKTDYVHPFKKGLRLEAGLKFSLVHTDNTVDYLRNNGSGFSMDDRSNHFLYDENINAAYGILSKTIKKWELTGGLRLENTVSKGHQVKNDSIFKRNYTSLFPNAGITWNASEKNQLSVSYSRRISRPDYEDLNPFVFFLDSLTYEEGNPYLLPEFTNNIEVSHTYRRFLTTTLNYTQTSNIITQLLKQDTQKRTTYVTKDNFNSMKQYGIAMMVNMPIVKWWNVNVYANVYNNHYKGVYNADPVSVQFTSLNTNMNNSFTLGKGWTGEVSGWYNSKALRGLLVSNPMGSVNAGLSKQVLKKMGTVKLGINDIFSTQQFSGYVKYSDVNVDVRSRRSSRQFNINFNYRFGKKDIPAARRKSGGADDEQNRVKSGGGN